MRALEELTHGEKEPETEPEPEPEPEPPETCSMVSILTQSRFFIKRFPS